MLFSKLRPYSQAVLTIVGGVAGYVRTRSIPSIVAGVCPTVYLHICIAPFSDSLIIRPQWVVCIWLRGIEFGRALLTDMKVLLASIHVYRGLGFSKAKS
jgi:Transmembrane proteins 14C